MHRDELPFQTVHQSSELWFKHAWNEVEKATRLVDARDLAAAIRLLRRACAHTHARENEDLYQLAELLTEWDERVG